MKFSSIAVLVALLFRPHAASAIPLHNTKIYFVEDSCKDINVIAIQRDILASAMRAWLSSFAILRKASANVDKVTPPTTTPTPAQSDAFTAALVEFAKTFIFKHVRESEALINSFQEYRALLCL
jgi:hypothetical protein